MTTHMHPESESELSLPRAEGEIHCQSETTAEQAIQNDDMITTHDITSAPIEHPDTMGSVNRPVLFALMTLTATLLWTTRETATDSPPAALAFQDGGTGSLTAVALALFALWIAGVATLRHLTATTNS